MSNNIKNVTKSIGHILSAATSIVAVSTEVLADGTGLVSGSVTQTPAVMKALLSTPFAAAKGYLMEAEGMNEADAEAIAYKYVQQELAVTIQEAGEGAGKLMATLFDDDEPAANDADTEKDKQTA